METQRADLSKATQLVGDGAGTPACTCASQTQVLGCSPDLRLFLWRNQILAESAALRGLFQSLRAPYWQ